MLGAGGYENTIHAEIQKLIIRDKRLNGLIYEADVRIWVSDDGSFERFTISLLEDDEDVERELNRFFASIAGINKPKPLQEQDNKWFDFRFKSSSSL